MKRAGLLALVFIFFSCQGPNQTRNSNDENLSGNIIIFHAGSLSVPFQKIAKAFEQENPGVKVLLEASGSVDCARKIRDLNKPCDLMASSDYKVIKDLLIPDHTSWYLPFAGNEMVIAYNDKSRKSQLITPGNWYEILLGEDIHFGRSEPDADPCGYRTLIVIQLAGMYYGKPGIISELSSKDQKYIRPKEVDLLALLELNETDYIFIYKSVAIQHGLKYVELPPEINLGDMNYSNSYQKAIVTIKGATPETKLEVSGETIEYAVTLIDDAQNPDAARAFLEFLLDKNKGMKILEESGHNSLIPFPNRDSISFPAFLSNYITEAKILSNKISSHYENNSDY
jgi:molybdate/tungstate transport system substrate-binding protein